MNYRRMPFLRVALLCLIAKITLASGPPKPSKTRPTVDLPNCTKVPCLDLRFTGLEVFFPPAKGSTGPLTVKIVDAVEPKSKDANPHFAFVLYPSTSVKGTRPAGCSPIGQTGYSECALKKYSNIKVLTNTVGKGIKVDDCFRDHVVSLTGATGKKSLDIDHTKFLGEVSIAAGSLIADSADHCWYYNGGYSPKPAELASVISDLSGSSEIDIEVNDTKLLSLRVPVSGFVEMWVVNVRNGEEKNIANNDVGYPELSDPDFQLFETVLVNQSLPVPIRLDTCRILSSDCAPMRLLTLHGHNCPPTQYP